MKKTLISCLISVVVCATIILGLHFSGLITLNLPSMSTTDTELDEISGFLDNTNIEPTTGDSLSGGIVEDLPAEEEIVDPTVRYPYNGTTAVTGNFTFVGNQASGNAIYSYKVRQGGYRGGIETRWRAYAQALSIPSSQLLYTDEIGTVISSSQALTPGQVVFVEISGYTNTIASGAVSNEPAETNLTATIANLATSCQAYYNFFQCAVKPTKSSEKSLVSTQLLSFIDVLGSISPNAQNTKCTAMIYDAKSSIVGDTTVSQECLDLLK